ncbi:hypothetical protein B0H34DRAFT_793440 [Crassisporium funariophilum]|nr:hypothetical protein B0H34DRAFT_793440 [Crassisporium funariophilum]
MSRSRSVSLEIVPPAGSRPAGRLADVMDSAFRNNSKEDEEDNKGLDDADADADEEISVPRVPGNNPLSVFPPVPCERCVRTNKTCKGVAGARCDYCKRLKQKCSNSTGPARGKHATPKKVYEVASTSKAAAPKAGSSDSSKWPDRPKRKASGKPNMSQNDDSDDGDGTDDVEDGHELPPKMSKKRRITKSSSGPSRALLARALGDMEASVKRVQLSVAKEVEKMNGIIKTLNARVKEMEED